MEGMLLSAWNVGSTKPRNLRDTPLAAPSTVAAAAPDRKPHNTRHSVATVWSTRSPDAASDATV